MSTYDGEVKYSYPQVKILSCDKPTYWYADKVGEVVETQKRTFVKRDGEEEHASYWVFDENTGGYTKSLGEIEEV